MNCKWSDAVTDPVLIECTPYKGKQPSLCFVVNNFSHCLTVHLHSYLSIIGGMSSLKVGSKPFKWSLP